MRAAAVIRAEVRRFWSDPVNGKFLLLLPAAVLLSLWPYAGTPLIPLFLFLFAGLEPQFNNILYRTPREFDALALLPVEWRAVVAAKNAAAILTFLASGDVDLAAVRGSMQRETSDFVAAAVADDGGALATLLAADFTVVDPTLRQLYGLPAATGDDDTRASLVGTPRRGLRPRRRSSPPTPTRPTRRR